MIRPIKIIADRVIVKENKASSLPEENHQESNRKLCLFVRPTTSYYRKVSNWLLHFKQPTACALIYFYFCPGNFRSRFHGGL